MNVYSTVRRDPWQQCQGDADTLSICAPFMSLFKGQNFRIVSFFLNDKKNTTAMVLNS